MQSKIDLPSIHPITSVVRAAVFAAWNHKCAYCETGPAEHVDHIWPRALGGANHVENYVASCKRCNLAKTDLPLSPGFLEILSAQALRKAPRVLARMKKPRATGQSSRKYPSAPDRTFITIDLPLPLIPRILQLEGYLSTHVVNTIDVQNHNRSKTVHHLNLSKHVSPDMAKIFRQGRPSFESPHCGGLLYSDASLPTEGAWHKIQFSGTYDFFRLLRIARALEAPFFSFPGQDIPDTLTLIRSENQS